MVSRMGVKKKYQLEFTISGCRNLKLLIAGKIILYISNSKKYNLFIECFEIICRKMELVMKEIRLHGRGGMGTVKASEIIVYAKVAANGYGNSIPFFGFERQGAPVTAFVRLDDKPIRPKTQVYAPDCVIVLDPTIQNAVDVFKGITDGGIFVVNTAEAASQVAVPPSIGTVAAVDATSLALSRLGKGITNTAMLGAFVKATEWVSLEDIVEKVTEYWGKKNGDLVREAYELTEIAHPGAVSEDSK